MTIIGDTVISKSDFKENNSFLEPASFEDIANGKLNPYFLIGIYFGFYFLLMLLMFIVFIKNILTIFVSQMSLVKYFPCETSKQCKSKTKIGRGWYSSYVIQSKPSRVDYYICKTISHLRTVYFVFSGNDLECCLWGKYAEQIESHLEENEGQTLLCLIRFAKINSYKGIDISSF